MTTMMLTSMVQSTKIGDEPTSFLNHRVSFVSSLGDISDGEDGQDEQLVAVNFIDSSGGGMKHSTSMASFHGRTNSILKKSPSSTNGGGMRRSSSAVSFGSVSVREHERVVEDVPTLHGP